MTGQKKKSNIANLLKVGAQNENKIHNQEEKKTEPKKDPDIIKVETKEPIIEKKSKAGEEHEQEIQSTNYLDFFEKDKKNKDISTTIQISKNIHQAFQMITRLENSSPPILFENICRDWLKRYEKEINKTMKKMKFPNF